jgi:hypothetical protein
MASLDLSPGFDVVNMELLQKKDKDHGPSE